jgi:hypothetical protein
MLGAERYVLHARLCRDPSRWSVRGHVIGFFDDHNGSRLTVTTDTHLIHGLDISCEDVPVSRVCIVP